MKHCFSVFLVLLFTMAALPLFAQDDDHLEPELGKTLENLKKQALEVEIHARILGTNQESVWTTKTSEVTVSGKSVSITLEGDNLKVVALLIPFLNEDQSLFLIAKGEVWVQERPNEEKKYYSTVKSLPIQAGESVIFFPTGMLMDSENESIYTIELEIQVEPLG